MKPTLCTVDFIYIVSRHLVYSNSDYYLEREYSSPYVVHTSYEDDGYLSFLLPIMYNSTYFLVVKDEYFLQAFPDGNWINKAISRIRKNQHPTIVTCNGKPQTRYGSVVADTDGSILMETRYLRYILTMTDFRRSSISPFFFFSQAVLCRFNAAIVTQTCPFFDAHYVSKSSYLASLFGIIFLRIVFLHSEYKMSIVPQFDLRITVLESFYHNINANMLMNNWSQFMLPLFLLRRSFSFKMVISRTISILQRNTQFKDIFGQSIGIHHFSFVTFFLFF